MYALITGASSGIGEALAKRMAANGHSLFLVARREERLKKLCEKLSNENPQCHTIRYASVDISKIDELKAWTKSEETELRKMDTLINNAGLALGTEAFFDVPEDELLQMIQSNLSALVLLTRRILPLWVPQKRGHVLNMGSVAGRNVYKGGSVYCATKSAVHFLTDALRMDLGGTGIRVSTIAPGRVAETEFSQVRLRGDKAKADALYQGYRTMSADDVAEAALWILERPAHINIQEMILMSTDQISATAVEPLS